MATASELYLSPEQRNLLLAALNSNSTQIQNGSGSSHNRSLSNDSFSGSMNNSIMNNNTFSSPDMLNADSVGDLDYNFGMDDSFKYEYGNEDDEDEKVPPFADHDKRKHSSEDDDDDSPDPHDLDPKRREGDDKTGKKPGRKPLTNEPTTKRKAQNRAAQRAFRERKEKHLKDLELKVIELEKKSESTDHENKILKDQVDTLQAEVKSYRKRLSLDSEAMNRSPSSALSAGTSNNAKRMSGGANGSGGFSFDFPMFGNVGQHIFNNGANSRHSNDANNISVNHNQAMPRLSYGPGSVVGLNKSNSDISHTNNDSSVPHTQRSSSTGSLANKNNNIAQIRHTSIDNSKLNPSSITDFSGLFSPSIIEAANKDSGNDYLSMGSSSIQTTPLLSGGLLDFSTSPSASSASQSSSRRENNNIGGFESSCDTSPEPMMSNSPLTYKQDLSFGQLNAITEEGENKAVINYNTEPSFSWLADQNGGSFDPILFNEYRDPIDQINSGIGMSFFEDAFPGLDFNLNVNLPSQVASKNTLAPELNDNNDDDEVVPGEDPKIMLNCTTIWDRIHEDPRVTPNDFDMDGLCSELRQKAKCSDMGVVVAEKDVDFAINKMKLAKRDSL